MLRKPTATEKVVLGYHGPALGDSDHAPLAVLSRSSSADARRACTARCVIEQEIATDLRGWVSTFRDPGLYEMYSRARRAHRRRIF